MCLPTPRPRPGRRATRAPTLSAAQSGGGALKASGRGGDSPKASWMPSTVCEEAGGRRASCRASCLRRAKGREKSGRAWTVQSAGESPTALFRVKVKCRGEGQVWESSCAFHVGPVAPATPVSALRWPPLYIPRCSPTSAHRWLLTATVCTSTSPAAPRPRPNPRHWPCNTPSMHSTRLL